MSQSKSPKARYRLTADVPAATDARVRQTARSLYRGVLSDAVTSALDTFHWILSARLRGKRVIATDPELLPSNFEEPIIPGLDALNEEWTWLVRRDHPWRRQLWIKGRSLTAGDLARTAAIEGWSPEEAAREYDVPVDAVLEAQRYAETANELIVAEEAENRIAAQRHERPSAAVR